MKGLGKLHQNITNYTAKDFSISNNATQSKAMLDKNSIGKKSLKEKVSLFHDVNFDSGSDRYFGENLGLLPEMNFNPLIRTHKYQIQ